MQPEARIVKRIQKYLLDEGAVSFKIHGGDSPFQEVGIPDLLCCVKGRFVAIEVKQPGEEPSPLQQLALRRIEAAGGVSIVADSVDAVRDELTRKGVL